MESRTYRGRRWAYAWLDICSIHQQPQRTCPRCMTGSYHWRPALWLHRAVKRLWPQLWYWWVNRPKSRQRRDIEVIFPRLSRRPQKGPRR